MKNPYSLKKLWKSSRNLLLTFSFLLGLTFVWQTSFITTNNAARAATLKGKDRLVAELGSTGPKNQIEGFLDNKTEPLIQKFSILT